MHHVPMQMVLATTAAMLAVSTGTAAAAPGLERVYSPPHAPDSTRSKSATATCPAGKRVVGAGGELIAANGRIVMSRITPDRALTRVTVVSLEDAGPTVVPW